jgi:hypothetical protein
MRSSDLLDFWEEKACGGTLVRRDVCIGDSWSEIDGSFVGDHGNRIENVGDMIDAVGSGND